MEKILVTGSSGFIGMHVCLSLLKKKNTKILGIDNLNNYYDLKLKLERNKNLKKFKNFTFQKIDLADKIKTLKTFKKFKPDYVIHLAAQAGVRYSFKNPYSYKKSNLDSFLNILEASRLNKIKHLTYASSSSVYGENFLIPFSEEDHVNHPTSFYAATKKSNELMAHVYSSCYNLPTTGLRFFTVYGPWGRPDMAYYIFAEAIKKGKTINLHDNGNMLRDFTYIEDVTKIVKKIYKKIPKKSYLVNQKINNSQNRYKIVNIGNSKPVKVKKLVMYLEKELKKKLKYKNIKPQMGELKSTYASTKFLKEYTNLLPKTNLEKGIKYFVDWYKNYNK